VSGLATTHFCSFFAWLVCWMISGTSSREEEGAVRLRRIEEGMWVSYWRESWRGMIFVTMHSSPDSSVEETHPSI
jgi:hypothetical protein